MRVNARLPLQRHHSCKKSVGGNALNSWRLFLPHCPHERSSKIHLRMNMVVLGQEWCFQIRDQDNSKLAPAPSLPPSQVLVLPEVGLEAFLWQSSGPHSDVRDIGVGLGNQQQLLLLALNDSRCHNIFQVEVITRERTGLSAHTPLLQITVWHRHLHSNIAQGTERIHRPLSGVFMEDAVAA